MYEKTKKEFREYLKGDNKSSSSIYNWSYRLKYFYIFLDEMEINSPLDITSDVLKEYRRYLNKYINRKGDKDSPRTTNAKIQAVRIFLRFLYKEGYLPSDYSSYIPYIKEPKSLPKVILSNREVKKILKKCDTQSLTGYRDRTILEVLYSSGLRRNEVINLKPDDIDTEDGYIRVNKGKGNKDRVVPLGKIACKYAENYQTAIRKLLLAGKEEIPWLFVSKRGKKLDRESLRNIVIKSAKRAKIEKTVTTHTFRRSCATEMLRNNANIMHVKDILGHEKLSTTQMYARLTIVDLKKAHNKFHPRERDFK